VNGGSSDTVSLDMKSTSPIGWGMFSRCIQRKRCIYLPAGMLYPRHRFDDRHRK
jgi:hypothetical protein